MILRLNKICCIAIAAISIACSTNNKSVNLDDFNSVCYTPKYAAGFEILTTADSTATLLKITKPWQGATKNDHHLIILNEEYKEPENTNCAVLKAPAKRVITLSSSNIAMIDAIGESHRIVGVSGIGYISNSTVIDSYKSGKTLDIGYGSNLNFEAIVALRPDIVLLYGVVGDDLSVTAKLNELGIQYIYIGEYAEESPLAKAEWGVAIGEICGSRALATEIFKATEQRYTSLRDSLKTLISTDTIRPKVMLNTPYREVWYMPSSMSYMAQLIDDAGGEYIYTENTSNTAQPISIERAYQLVSQADVWLNMGATIRTSEALKRDNPIFAEMEVVKQNALYNTTARTTPMGGSDFWESGVVNPDVVLHDLIKILHPTAVPQHELYYYERLK